MADVDEETQSDIEGTTMHLCIEDKGSMATPMMYQSDNSSNIAVISGKSDQEEKCNIISLIISHS